MSKRKAAVLSMVIMCICTLPGCIDADALFDSGVFNTRGWWFVMLFFNFFIIILMINFLRRLKKAVEQKPEGNEEFKELCRKVISMKIEKETDPQQ